MFFHFRWKATKITYFTELLDGKVLKSLDKTNLDVIFSPTY